LLGSLHLSTVLVFDLGVYLLVVGATMLILVSLAHQSLRSQRKGTSGPEAIAQREAAV
jgi:multicomponent K+:H+ antiporter subunit A